MLNQLISPSSANLMVSMKHLILYVAIAATFVSGCKQSTEPSTQLKTFDFTTLRSEAFEGSWILSKIDGAKAESGYGYFIDRGRLTVRHQQCRTIYKISGNNDTLIAKKYQDSCVLTGPSFPDSIIVWSVVGSKLVLKTNGHTLEFAKELRSGTGIEKCSGWIGGILRPSGELWTDFIDPKEGNSQQPNLDGIHYPNPYSYYDHNFPSPNNYVPQIGLVSGQYTTCYLASAHDYTPTPSSFSRPTVSQYGYDLFIVSDDAAGHAVVWIGDGKTGWYATVTYGPLAGYTQDYHAISFYNPGGPLDGLLLETGTAY